jgi:hypothetical protein
MSGTVPFGVASATEMQRRQCQTVSDTDIRVSVVNFGRHAKLAWPFKTAAHIAAIGKVSERHAARMLSGEFEPTGVIAAALIQEIFKRE